MASAGGTVLGIDLGTTNSVIASATGGRVRVLVDDEGNALHPSVVAFLPTGERLVGHRARARRVVDPANTIFSVKRILGRPFAAPATRAAIDRLPYRVVEGTNQEPMVVTRTGELSVVDIAATVLIYLRQLAENQLERPVTHCVITVPANFTEGQRQATRQAVQRAGMVPLRILNEPTAAALAYGSNRSVHQRLVVFDMGGGTLDVTLLSVQGDLYEVIATGGEAFLGGDDMDQALAALLTRLFQDQHGMAASHTDDTRVRLLWAAERIKHQLTGQEVASGTIADIPCDNGQRRNLPFHIGREQLETAIAGLVDRAIDTVAGVLRAAQVLPRHVDEVILVGGATLVPYVQRRVGQFFGRAPSCTIDPMQVVAAGAAIHAASLMSAAGGDPGAGGLLLDVLSHSLGVATAGGYAEFLIDKNTPIPAEGTRIFHPARDGQSSIRIRVCQGENKHFDDNSLLGELVLDDLRPGSRGETRVEVSFLVDENGVLEVSARDMLTGQIQQATLSVLGVNPDGTGDDTGDQAGDAPGDVPDDVPVQPTP